MSYTETWDETKPSGGRNINLGDNDITEFKRGIRERLATDHCFLADETGETKIGLHKKVSFYTPLTSDPTAEANVFHFYSKDASGKVELFGRDEDGNIIQITTEGHLRVLDNIQELTTDTSDVYLLKQYGWSFANPDGTGYGNKAITFPAAFGAIPYSIILQVYGYNNLANPTTIDDCTYSQLDYAPGFAAQSALGFTARIHGPNNVRQLFSWMAVGIPA